MKLLLLPLLTLTFFLSPEVKAYDRDIYVINNSNKSIVVSASKYHQRCVYSVTPKIITIEPHKTQKITIDVSKHGFCGAKSTIQYFAVLKDKSPSTTDFSFFYFIKKLAGSSDVKIRRDPANRLKRINANTIQVTLH